MKIDYDTVADAIYFTLKEGKIAKSIKVYEHLILDVSSSGDVVGMEILNASSKQARELKKNIENGVPINIITSTPAIA